MLLKDFSQFVFEGAMGCFFSCGFIVADTPNLHQVWIQATILKD